MATIETIAKRDGRKCRYCGKKHRLTIEHLTPRCRGGGDDRGNLGISCSVCNRDKGPLTEAEFLALRGDLRRLKSYRLMINNLITERAVIDGRIKEVSRDILGVRLRRRQT